MPLKERPESPWYKISDMPPPYTVQVEILVCGRHFIGARGQLPKRTNAVAVVWSEWVRGQPRRVPEDVAEALDQQDGLWRPQKPEMWQAPLPAPVALVEPRMWAARSRFAAVEEAEAAELAREMERDREMARSGQNDADPVRRAFEAQWWRDATQIRYETSGETTLRMIEGRLLRALACAGIAIKGGLARSSNLVWEIGELAARELAEIEAETPSDRIPRLELLPADRDDWLKVMAWFAALNPPPVCFTACKRLMTRSFAVWDDLCPAQKVLLYRAGPVPLSYSEIGHEMKWKGHQRAKQVFDQAIADCWRMSNGMKSRPGLRARDTIAELRARNRAARLGGAA